MILAKLRKTIESNNIFNPGDKVVLGVSGGSDSIGLLNLLLQLTEYKLEIIVAHVNHKLRNKESERDAKFVRKTAKSLKIQFEYLEVSTLEFKEKNKLSLEDAARRLRYDFFYSVMSKHSANLVVTAHTSDDQAETVLMRLLRGSGVQGLSGISPISGKLARPAINLTSDEIKKYLKSKKISWVEDSSNKLLDFQRNKIRHELIPFLESYNSNIKNVLSRSAEVMRIEAKYLDGEVNKAFKKTVFITSIGHIGNCKKYLKLDRAIKFGIIRKAIMESKGDLNSITYDHILKIDSILESDKVSAEINLPGNICFFKGHKFFCITNKNVINQKFEYRIDKEGKTKFSKDFFADLCFTKDKSDWGNENVGHFLISYSDFPLKIRSFKSGDKFIPLGMRRFKKVKDFFIDEKIPRFIRRKIPIVETTNGDIVWICGLRVDDRFKADKNKKFLKIKVKSPNVNLLNFFQDS